VIIVLPAVTPLTTPEPEPTVATGVLPLLHIPPAVASDNVIVDPPSQTATVPEIAEGAGFTVITVIAAHPDGKVYMIVAVPPATPVTTPVPVPTIATAVLLLLHVPPPDASLSVVVKPGQTTVVPVIGETVAFTVTVVTFEHPVGSV
jgi:hypothetical protein